MLPLPYIEPQKLSINVDKATWRRQFPIKLGKLAALPNPVPRNKQLYPRIYGTLINAIQSWLIPTKRSAKTPGINRQTVPPTRTSPFAPVTV